MQHTLSPLDDKSTIHLCEDALERAIQAGTPEAYARFFADWGEALRQKLMAMGGRIPR